MDEAGRFQSSGCKMGLSMQGGSRMLPWCARYFFSINSLMLIRSHVVSTVPGHSRQPFALIVTNIRPLTFHRLQQQMIVDPVASGPPDGMCVQLALFCLQRSTKAGAPPQTPARLPCAKSSTRAIYSSVRLNHRGGGLVGARRTVP